MQDWITWTTGGKAQSGNSLMDSVGEGEGGKIWENGIETCKISCMKRDASPGYWMLGASALGRPRGMVWGGRRKEG